MNQQLIARLRSGEIAAENNGSLEQLREVLKAAFEGQRMLIPEGKRKYYFKGYSGLYGYGSSDVIDRPTVPITDFFTPSIEDRAVELLREVKAKIKHSINFDETLRAKIEQFLNELNK